MPKLSADDVPHTTQTDHRIPRSHVAIPVPISGRDAEPSVPEELLIFDQEGCPLSDLERQRARGLMLIEKAEWESRPELAGDALPLLIQSAAAAPDDLDVLDGLALAHMLRGDASRAVATWKRVLERFPDQKDALYSLAVHFHNRGDSRQAAEYLERFVERYPWDAEMLGRYSHVLSESGKLDEAILTAEESLRRNPSLSRTYAWLAELYQRQGDHRQSDHYRRLWLRVQ